MNRSNIFKSIHSEVREYPSRLINLLFDHKEDLSEKEFDFKSSKIRTLLDKYWFCEVFIPGKDLLLNQSKVEYLPQNMFRAPAEMMKQEIIKFDLNMQEPTSLFDETNPPYQLENWYKSITQDYNGSYETQKRSKRKERTLEFYSKNDEDSSFEVPQEDEFSQSSGEEFKDSEYEEEIIAKPKRKTRKRNTTHRSHNRKVSKPKKVIEASKEQLKKISNRNHDNRMKRDPKQEKEYVSWSYTTTKNSLDEFNSSLSRRGSQL